MGVPECVGCVQCGTTLETHSSLHTAPIDHEWREEFALVDRRSEKTKKIRVCQRCHRKEDVSNATGLEEGRSEQQEQG
jgi:hypothetical protein